MIECSGVCYFNTAEAVTGRLCRTEMLERHCDIAQILMWDGKSELSEATLSSAVGVVFPDDIPDDAKSLAICLARICSLPTLGLTSQSIPKTHGIAILDTTHSRLYVDPDLETICAHLGAKAKDNDSGVKYLLKTNTPVTVSGSRFEGLLISTPPYTDEQRYYDHLCEIADVNTGARIVATARALSAETFLSDAKAILRAGVWGRFSILYTNVCAIEQADVCSTLFARAIDELKQSNTEFNATIPKGLLINAPSVLLSPQNADAFDFYCFDFERLRHLLTSSGNTEIGERQTARYLASFVQNAQGARIFLDGTERVSKAALSYLLKNARVHSICKSHESGEFLT